VSVNVPVPRILPYAASRTAYSGAQNHGQASGSQTLQWPR
jgi:hypothetical protein